MQTRIASCPTRVTRQCSGIPHPRGAQHLPRRGTFHPEVESLRWLCFRAVEWERWLQNLPSHVAGVVWCQATQSCWGSSLHTVRNLLTEAPLYCCVRRAVRYAKSRSETQLRGEKNSSSGHGVMSYLSADDSTSFIDKCAPVQYAADGGVVDPCGLVSVLSYDRSGEGDRERGSHRIGRTRLVRTRMPMAAAPSRA